MMMVNQLSTVPEKKMIAPCQNALTEARSNIMSEVRTDIVDYNAEKVAGQYREAKQ